MAVGERSMAAGDESTFRKSLEEERRRTAARAAKEGRSQSKRKVTSADFLTSQPERSTSRGERRIERASARDIYPESRWIVDSVGSANRNESFRTKLVDHWAARFKTE